MRIAILDNDLQQRSLLMDALASAQHACVPYDHFDKLLTGLRDGETDLLVYHWQPEAEGLRQLLELRQARPSLPTLLLTGRASEQELAKILTGGCCDYLVKPLRRSELMMRLRVLLSRATILESVWSQDTEFNSRTMDTHVSRIRTKLGLRPDRGFRLAPVYSYGYRLEKLAG